jgi:hypothetical protein
MKLNNSSIALALSPHQKHLTRFDRIYVERKNSLVFIRKMRRRADLPGLSLDAFNVSNPVFMLPLRSRRTGSLGNCKSIFPEYWGSIACGTRSFENCKAIIHQCWNQRPCVLKLRMVPQQVPARTCQLISSPASEAIFNRPHPHALEDVSNLR